MIFYNLLKLMSNTNTLMCSYSIRGYFGFRTEQFTKIAPQQPWRKEIEEWPPRYDRTQ